MGKPKPKRSDGRTPAPGGRGGGGGGGGKKRRRNSNKPNKNNRQQKRPRNGKSDMTVVLTRVELTDDHVHAPAPLVLDRPPAPAAALEESSGDGVGGTSEVRPEAAAPGKEIGEEGGAKTDHDEGTKGDGDSAKGRDVDGDGEVGGSDAEETTKSPDVPADTRDASCTPQADDTNQAEATTRTAGDDGKSEQTHQEVGTTSSVAAKEDGHGGDGDEMEDEEEEKPKEQKEGPKPYINIVKSDSARGKLKLRYPHSKKKKGSAETKYTPLPDGDCGDGIKNPHPKDVVADKYWAQRRRLFSRYDEGIQIDGGEGWYSVTPEAIAVHVATRVTEIVASSRRQRSGAGETLKRGAVILDAFCGCGGNAIAFARQRPDDVSLVVGVDIDRSKLRMAAHNACVYGISPERLVFIEADAVLAMRTFPRTDGKGVSGVESDAGPEKDEEQSTIEVCEGFKIGGLDLLPQSIDSVFLSPPWGGMNYGNAGKMGYDIATSIQLPPTTKGHGDEGGDAKGRHVVGRSEAVNGEELLKIASGVTDSKVVVYFLPRNTNGVALGRAALKAGYRGSLELEQNYLNAKLKTMTAYMYLSSEHINK